MSRRHLLILVALASSLTVTVAVCAAPQAGPSPSVRDLLIKDDFVRAEAILQSAPRSADTTAFQGEIEFRKGNFEKARELY